MAIQGTFRIMISGKPLEETSNIKLKERVSGLVRKLDLNAKLDERTFARLEFTFIWTGIPINFGNANPLLKFIDEKVGEYLKDWTTDIKIQLMERGE